MWDTIVIGSGIGGLGAAAALAHRGQARAGARTAHRRRAGRRRPSRARAGHFATGVHYIGGVGPQPGPGRPVRPPAGLAERRRAGVRALAATPTTSCACRASSSASSTRKRHTAQALLRALPGAARGHRRLVRADGAGAARGVHAVRPARHAATGWLGLRLWRGAEVEAHVAPHAAPRRWPASTTRSCAPCSVRAGATTAPRRTPRRCSSMRWSPVPTTPAPGFRWAARRASRRRCCPWCRRPAVNCGWAPRWSASSSSEAALAAWCIGAGAGCASVRAAHVISAMGVQATAASLPDGSRSRLAGRSRCPAARSGLCGAVSRLRRRHRRGRRVGRQRVDLRERGHRPRLAEPGRRRRAGPVRFVPFAEGPEACRRPHRRGAGAVRRRRLRALAGAAARRAARGLPGLQGLGRAAAAGAVSAPLSGAGADGAVPRTGHAGDAAALRGCAAGRHVRRGDGRPTGWTARRWTCAPPCRACCWPGRT